MTLIVHAPYTFATLPSCIVPNWVPTAKRESVFSCLSGILQTDQSPDHDAGTGAQTDYIQFRPPEQAFNSGPHTRAQPALLLHSHQLQVHLSCQEVVLSLAVYVYFLKMLDSNVTQNCESDSGHLVKQAAFLLGLEAVTTLQQHVLSLHYLALGLHNSSVQCCLLHAHNLLCVGTCRKHELEENMLMNLQKKTWTHGLTLKYAPTSCVFFAWCLCQFECAYAELTHL